MSELINKWLGQNDFRWQLLATVSAAALVASAYGAGALAEDDADRPTVWIELGGQLERIDGSGQLFDAPFMGAVSQAGFTSPLHNERPPLFSNGAEGKISFEPDGMNWIFSAAVRYGRSNSSQHVHQQAPGKQWHDYRPASTYRTGENLLATATKFEFSDTLAKHDESHMVLDFQAGTDIGLGMFGRDDTSVLSLGVRFAQFTSRMSAQVAARPNVQILPYTYLPPAWHFSVVGHYRNYALAASSARSFRGVGPSLSWNASAPVLGNPQVGEASLEWGANAAILFGRQKMSSRHQTSGRNYSRFIYPYSKRRTSLYQTSNSSVRVRSVIVPNFGGFAGLSYRVQNFKVSAGYRADFFFGAIDGGIDTRKEQTLGFFGPFATISIGLGG